MFAVAFAAIAAIAVYRTFTPSHDGAVSNLPSHPSASKPQTERSQQHDQAETSPITGQGKKASPYDPGCPYPKSREDADLCEQRRMADAAKKTEQFVERQFVINVVQAFFTAFAAIAAAYAAYEAGRAARAAMRSADVANRSLTHLERAFVVFKDIHRVGNELRKGESYAMVMVEIENSGTTPPRHLITQATFRVFDNAELKDGDLPADFQYLDVETGSDPASFVLGPKASARLNAFGIKFSDLERIDRGEARGYIWGWSEYDDIFDDTPRHRTEYCFWIRTIAKPISSGHIEWAAYKHHNGLDDECPREHWRTTKSGVWIEPRKPKLPPG
jgi:hypothetical protein